VVEVNSRTARVFFAVGELKSTTIFSDASLYSCKVGQTPKKFIPAVVTAGFHPRRSSNFSDPAPIGASFSLGGHYTGSDGSDRVLIAHYRKSRSLETVLQEMGEVEYSIIAGVLTDTQNSMWNSPLTG
jgi:hypothetical protein